MTNLKHYSSNSGKKDFTFGVIDKHMKVEKYQLKSERHFTTFEFISEGPKGLFRKKIEFQETSTPNLYNLAFGDTNVETGEIDDLAVSNNSDTEKVLATVVAAVYAFFEKHPTAYVYATGSSNARTRLYRIGITKFYDEMVKDFYLYGQVGDDFFPFEPGTRYTGFLAQQKFK
jgi:hypothetical protein